MNINKLFEEIKSKELELFELKLTAAIEKAYLKGVEDGQKLIKSKYEYPDRMRKADLAKFFKCSLPQVEKIIRMEGFPRCKAVQARYPRDEVFKWADKNTEYMNEQLGIYISREESERIYRSSFQKEWF